MGFLLGHEGWTLHNDEVKKYLGPNFGGKYGPDDRMASWCPARQDGEKIQVRILLMTREEAKRKHPRSSKPRRLHAECPKCHRLVCAGHTQQHKC